MFRINIMNKSQNILMDRRGRAPAAEDAAVSSCDARNDVIDSSNVQSGGGGPKLDSTRSQRSDSVNSAMPAAPSSTAKGLFNMKGKDWRLSVAGCLSHPAVLGSPKSDPPDCVGNANGRRRGSKIARTSGVTDDGKRGKVPKRRGGNFRRLWGSGIVLILPNGTSHTYDHPVTVSAILEEFSTAFPNHFVLEVCEDVAGRPSLDSPRLPTAHNLSSTKLYALHPNKYRKKRHRRPNVRDAFKGVVRAPSPRDQPTTRTAEEEGWVEVAAQTLAANQIAGDGSGKKHTEKGLTTTVIYEGGDARRTDDVETGPDVIRASNVQAADVRLENGQISEKPPEPGGWFSGRLGGCNGSGVQVADDSLESADSDTSLERSSWSSRGGLGLSARLARRSLSGSFQAVDGGEEGVLSGPALYQLAGMERVKSNQVADISQMVNELEVKRLEGGSGKGMLSRWEPALGPIKESRSWNSRKISPRHMRKVDRIGGNAKMRLMKSRLKGKVESAEADPTQLIA